MKQLCQIKLTDTFTSFENLVKEQITDFVLSDTDTYYLHQSSTIFQAGVEVLETDDATNLTGGKKYSFLPDAEYSKDITNGTNSIKFRIKKN